MPLERAQQLVRRWDLARASALWSSDDCRGRPRAGPSASGNEIDVLPPEPDQLAQAKARFEADQDHRPPRLVRTSDQPPGFLEVEEVELRVWTFSHLNGGR